ECNSTRQENKGNFVLDPKSPDGSTNNSPNSCFNGWETDEFKSCLPLCKDILSRILCNHRRRTQRTLGMGSSSPRLSRIVPIYVDASTTRWSAVVKGRKAFWELGGKIQAYRHCFAQVNGSFTGYRGIYTYSCKSLDNSIHRQSSSPKVNRIRRKTTLAKRVNMRGLEPLRCTQYTYSRIPTN
ncbi:7473_t:CDS:2, partial [Dentiscutata erythropus]